MMRKKKRTEVEKEQDSGKTEKILSKDLVLERKTLRTPRVAAASQGDKDSKPNQHTAPTSPSELHHDDKKPFSCHYKIKFTCKSTSANHIKNDNSHKILLNYNVSDSNFKTSDQLQMHSNHSTCKFSCDVCGKTFNYRSSIVNHMVTHDERQFECEYCHNSFKCKSNLKVHMRIHTGYRPYQCTVCERSFIQKTALNNHMLIHTGLKPHFCKLCKERFRQVSNLKMHMRKIHPKEDKDNKPKQSAVPTSHNCNICNRNFKTIDKLQTHLTDHLTGKFSCDVCGKKFKYQSSVVSHMITHSDERQFECEYCHKSFKTKGILQAHERIHTGYRPYQCTVCERSFIQKTALNNHMLTHTGLKPHFCKLCKERFRQVSNLKMHMRKIHSKDKGARKESVKSLECNLKSRRCVAVRQSIKLVFGKKDFKSD